MGIRIVTDSTCDLPAEIINMHRVSIIPMYIITPNGEMQDGIDLTRKEFYERLPGYKPHPTTAAPSPAVFKDTYEKLAREGASEIISIHISRKLSAVMDIANQAARETTAIPVTVFDSRQLSLGTGFQVITAVEAAEKGKSVDEIIHILKNQIQRTHVFAALDTLEYLRRSGRMNFALSFLGSLLRIKPFLKMYDGNPTAERVRTRDRAIKRLKELLIEATPLEKVGLLYSQSKDRAETLLQDVKHLLPEGDTLMEEINPVLGVHIGPGVVGFACITKK
jgi:DegV family protein with EDD domain